MHHIPLSTFTGVLKQVRTQSLRREEIEILNVCLPEFLRSSPRASPLLHAGIRRPSSFQPRPAGWGRLRRYAGSDSLSPGRYYSVCHDGDGGDRGTLLNELMSYWDESTMVFVDLYDSTLLSNEQRREFEHELAEPKLGLKLTRYQERRRLFRKPTIESAGQLVCSLPLSVQEVEIRGVVDLRMPDTQAWFFEQFVSLEQDIGLRGHLDAQTSTEVATFKYHKPRDFIDLLPTLVMPGIGGSTFHQGVGAWLRSNQVAGLVFPSARSDVYLKLLSEEGADQRRRLTFEFSGWNFVDYRDSGPADWDPLFGHLQSWVLAQKAGIEVRRHEGDGWGWEIIGAQEAEFSRVALGRDIMLGKVVAPPQWDPRGGYRRPYYQRREDLRSPGWAPFSR